MASVTFAYGTAVPTTSSSGFTNGCLYFNTSKKIIYFRQGSNVYQFNGNNTNTTYSNASSSTAGLLTAAHYTDLVNLNSTASCQLNLAVAKTLGSSGVMQSSASQAPLYAIVNRFTHSSKLYTTTSVVCPFTTGTSPTSATPYSMVGNLTQVMNASGSIVMAMPKVNITTSGSTIEWLTTSGVTTSVSSSMSTAIYTLRMKF